MSPSELWKLLLQDQVRIIDVRAPVEFQEGAIPASINLPILTNEERHQVGTAYKQEGSEAAVALGHQLVSGEVKSQRIQSWIQAIQQNPSQTVTTCFRGGLRSQLAQAWMAENGVKIPRLEGGYKAMRQFLLGQVDSFCHSQKIFVLTGKTGVGKTQFLQKMSDYPSVNLEALAHHRGSAFGAYSTPQPTQINYENNLALNIGKVGSPTKPVLIEDESRMIGRIVQPENFFLRLRESPVLLLEEHLEIRVENTFQEYVVARSHESYLFQDLQKNLTQIHKKLGGVRFQEIQQDLQTAEQIYRETKDLSPSRGWIEKLLVWYYDPLYEKSFAQREPLIAARGDRHQIRRFLV